MHTDDLEANKKDPLLIPLALEIEEMKKLPKVDAKPKNKDLQDLSITHNNSFLSD